MKKMPSKKLVWGMQQAEVGLFLLWLARNQCELCSLWLRAIFLSGFLSNPEDGVMFHQNIVDFQWTARHYVPEDNTRNYSPILNVILPNYSNTTHNAVTITFIKFYKQFQTTKNSTHLKIWYVCVYIYTYTHKPN
jgi:hypothetical protein